MRAGPARRALGSHSTCDKTETSRAGDLPELPRCSCSSITGFRPSLSDSFGAHRFVRSLSPVAGVPCARRAAFLGSTRQEVRVEGKKV